MQKQRKIIIYQVLPRLYGNTTEKCVPNGSIKENGCGKMNDFTLPRLREIKQLGATHVWYTGLIMHATQTNYARYGIAKDHPAVVKGKAGSPYAIKDYYDIDPDLAVDVAHRMDEFSALADRTHRTGLKMIIDFVPNHVARQYRSRKKPRKAHDLGADDDRSKAFSTQNNFYYLPGESFRCPLDTADPYVETPARVTGNNAFTAAPSVNDWYETIKLNYGIDYQAGGQEHFDPLPDTWIKMRDILLFWAAQGVDGFRCDMAEMVPCAFWHWAIKEIKDKYPSIIFIAEVYNPGNYRNYIQWGGFDYLYDKVGLYDTLRAITCGQMSASAITGCWQQLGDLQPRMLNFLENHDEQRLASDFFACDGRNGIAALAVSLLMNGNPFMIYAGQELGERGMDAEGFSGRDGRTTIFDYWSVPSLRDWITGKVKNGDDRMNLRNAYKALLTLSNRERAVREGLFFDLMYVNYDHPQTFNAERMYAFLRKAGKDLLLVCANFQKEAMRVEIRIPMHAFQYMKIASGEYETESLLTGERFVQNLRPDDMLDMSVPACGVRVLKYRLR